jgi:hypothetical protein
MSNDAKKPNLNEPHWSDIKVAKIIRTAFRDKGRLIDSSDHILAQKWAARDEASAKTGKS